MKRPENGKVATMADLNWFKSSYSTAQSNCVEVAKLTGEHGYGIRDSKIPAQTTLFTSEGEWLAFIEAVKTTRL